MSGRPVNLAKETTPGLQTRAGPLGPSGVTPACSPARTTRVSVIRAGEHAGVTPDGPKGPARVCKTGVVALAKLTGRPIILMGLDYARCWRLRNWDRFALPLPFSRVDVTFEDILCPSRDEEDGVVAARIQERLNALSGQ